MTKQNSVEEVNGIDVETVNTASRFLSKILRHKPEDVDISLNDRGWASVKSVRVVLNKHFDDRGYRILSAIMEKDDENRFQITPEEGEIVGDYAFIRATRGHTCDDVSLADVEPDEEDLNWYLVDYGGQRQSEYIEATSVEAAKRVAERRSGISVDWDYVEFEELDNSITWTRGPGGDDLSGNDEPHRILHQSGDKHLEVEKRVNQAGDKGRYITPQTKRVRDRMRK